MPTLRWLVARSASRSRAVGRAALALAISCALAGPAGAAIFLTGDYIQLPIDTSTLRGRFMAEGDASGARYNPAGTGGASGVDFWQPGTPVYNYTIAVNGSVFRVNGTGWAVAPIVTDTSGGTINSATITGQPVSGLTFTREVSFGDGDQFIRIIDTLTNSGGSPLNQVATLDNTDPDQLDFTTSNDVVTAQVPNDLATATGVDTPLTLGFGSPSPLRVVDCSGFSNTNPYSIIAAPQDPNGTLGDIGLDIAFNYGTLASGATVGATWFMVFSPDKPTALATYALATGCGDGMLGVGEECDDGGTTAGDGCDGACRTEPCYTCSGTPSTCTLLPDDAPCDDGLFCNGADTCSSGACTVHGGDPCPPGGPECANACNETANNCFPDASTSCTGDGNPCTNDVCGGDGTCTHPPVPSFTPCDDGVFCNGGDFCTGGECAIHQGNPCTGDVCVTSCNELLEMCNPTPDGTPCADDGFACTRDECNGAGACGHPPVAAGVACPDDGNVCTADQCDGAGFCGHPAGPAGAPCSDDSNACTDDECDDSGNCVHAALGDGTDCDDGDACTQTDTCQSGACTGSDPVVCTAALCHVPGTCDPSSGTCTDCPAGYASGAGGCQKTYAIGVGLLDNLGSFCDGTGLNRYNGCNDAPIGFHWTDIADAQVGAVMQVDIGLNAGLDCDGFNRAVSLNGTPIGVYASTAAGSCNCVPPVMPRLLADVDTSAYLKGGANAVSISGLGCAGLSAVSGRYATVTVTYEPPGPRLGLRMGCRQAATSSLRYRGDANDTRDRLHWRWSKGAPTTPAEFGDPTTSTDYQLCVFVESGGGPALLLGADVPDGAKWSAIGKGYKYRDAAATAGGMKTVVLRGGADGRSKLLVKGQGAALGDPALPLDVSTSGLRVQLTNTETGLCWESEFPLSTITADDQRIKATVR